LHRRHVGAKRLRRGRQFNTRLHKSGLCAAYHFPVVRTCIYVQYLPGHMTSLAAYAAALNVLAVARQHLVSLDRISRVVRLGVYIATAGDFSDHVTVADAASELLREILGDDKMSSRLVFGVESLPLGVPVELEVIFGVST
jgi:YjgF/chorismate_mutase-like, putative endoribonuclease